MVAGGATGEHSGMKCDSYREILNKNSPAGSRPKMDRSADDVARWSAGAMTTRTGKEISQWAC